MAPVNGEDFKRSLLEVRHPPQSGWLGEWGLKGGCPVVEASR